MENSTATSASGKYENESTSSTITNIEAVDGVTDFGHLLTIISDNLGKEDSRKLSLKLQFLDEKVDEVFKSDTPGIVISRYLKKYKIITATSPGRFVECLRKIDLNGLAKTVEDYYKTIKAKVAIEQSEESEMQEPKIDKGINNDESPNRSNIIKKGSNEENSTTRKRKAVEQCEESEMQEQAIDEGGHNDVFPETCRLKVIYTPNDDDADDDIGYLAAVCRIIEMEPTEKYLVGQLVGVYIFNRRVKFSKGRFYEFDKCMISNMENKFEILVSPETKISSISKKMIKIDLDERTSDDTYSEMYTQRRCLPEATVNEAKFIYESHRGVLSIYGIIFDIKYVEEFDNLRTTLKLCDNKDEYITVVVRDEHYPEDGLQERDVVKLTYLKTWRPVEGITNCLLFTEQTKLQTVKNPNPELRELLKMDSFASFKCLEGTVIKCKEIEKYKACPNCYQKKLTKNRKGTYLCLKCEDNVTDEEAETSFKFEMDVEVEHEDGVKELHKGVIFKKTTIEILKFAYPKLTTERAMLLLGDFMVEKYVTFTMKKSTPSNVFSNIKFPKNLP